MAEGKQIKYEDIASRPDIQALEKDLLSLGEAMAKLKTEISDVAKTMSKNPLKSGTDLKNYNKDLKDTSDITADVERIQQQTVRTQKKLEAARTADGQELAKAKLELQEFNREQKASIKQMAAAEGSMNRLALDLAQNKKAYRELTKAERENTKAGKDLLKTIQKQDKEIKDLDKSLGEHNRNVGNYGGSIGDLIAQYGGLPPQLDRVVNKMSLFTFSLKGMKAAIMATGIGALVVGLVSLVQYFKRTEEGASKLNKILNYIKIPIEVLLQAMGELGEKMVGAFENPKQAMTDFVNFLKGQIVNRVTALGSIFGELGNIIKDVFSGDFDNIKGRMTEIVKLSADFATGIENSHQVVAEKLNGALEESKSKIAEANDLEDRSLELTKRKRAFVVQEAELLAKIADARRIANDEEQDRITQARAIQEAEAYTNQLAQMRLGIAREELALMNQGAAMFDSDAETLDQIAQKEREVFEIQKAQDDLLRSISRRKATINNQLDKELEKVKGVRDVRLEIPGEKEQTDEFLKESETRIAQANKETSFETENVGKRQATQEDYFGAVADGFTVAKVLAGENAEAQKDIAIAEAIISTLQSAISSYNSLSGIPTVGPLLGAAAAAAALATGYARVREIRNTKIPRYFEGTEYLERGNNPKGRDTIPAFLNEGERVVPTGINNMLAGVSNPELPRLVRLGKMAESGAFSRMVAEQQRTNQLLGRYKIIYPDGRVEMLNGDKVSKVSIN